MAEITVRDAARNNAEWCDAFCRTHGIVGHWNVAAWTSALRTPSFYPDAVSVVPGCSVEALVSRVDASSGCSIKDSFADLDLAVGGFEILFTAEWVCLDRASLPRADRWSVVADPAELERWETAWGASPPERPFFRRELLTDPRISVLVRSEGGRVCGGAIANRGGDVVGLSNVFDLEGDIESVWHEAASAAQDIWGRIPVVGYEEGESLAAAHQAGFKTIGSLVVWINSPHL